MKIHGMCIENAYRAAKTCDHIVFVAPLMFPLDRVSVGGW